MPAEQFICAEMQRSMAMGAGGAWEPFKSMARRGGMAEGLAAGGQVWVGHVAQRSSRTSELLTGRVLWHLVHTAQVCKAQSLAGATWWLCTLNLHGKPWPLRGLHEQGVKL